MRVKCLAQEHNIMSPARARTRTARSGDERTNHEATLPPTWKMEAPGNGLLTLPSFARIKIPRWLPVEIKDQQLRSHGKIDDCEQSTFYDVLSALKLLPLYNIALIY